MNAVYAILLAVGLVVVLFKFGGLINEIFFSYGLYKSAKKNGDAQAWVSFVPFFRYFKFGHVLDGEVEIPIGLGVLPACLLGIISKVLKIAWMTTLSSYAVWILRGIGVAILSYKKNGRVVVWDIVLILLGLDGWVLMFAARD